MIVLQTTAAQTLAVGQSLTFNAPIAWTGCGECFRGNTAQVITRPNAMYDVSFTGNISGATAGTPVQLTIQASGASLLNLITTPTAAGEINNVSGNIPVSNACGLGAYISVTNTGTQPVVVEPGATLAVWRRA